MKPLIPALSWWEREAKEVSLRESGQIMAFMLPADAGILGRLSITHRVRLAPRVGTALQYAALRMPNDHTVQASTLKPIRQPIDAMPTLPQGLDHLGWDAPFGSHHAWEIGRRIGGVGEIIAVHARLLDCFLRIKAEFDGIEENLQRPLWDMIPTVTAQRHHGLSILEHQRRSRSKPWSLAGPERRRMPWLDLGLRAPQAERQARAG